MRIDAHGHACGEYVTLERLLTTLDKNNIDKVVLFPAEIGKDKITKLKDRKNKEILYFTNVIGEFFARFINLSSKIDFGNSYVHYLKLLAPNRIIQFYQLTPKYLHKLKHDYEQMHFSGIKLHQCVNYFSIKSDFFNDVLDFAEENNLPIQIHLYGKEDAKNIIEIAKHRKVKIIIAHLLYSKLFAESWNEIHNNIYFDLANYYFINQYSMMFAIEQFGCEKLIFGSDNPFGVNTIAKTIKMILNLPITQPEKDMILGNNMKELLKL